MHIDLGQHVLDGTSPGRFQLCADDFPAQGINGLVQSSHLRSQILAGGMGEADHLSHLLRQSAQTSQALGNMTAGVMPEVICVSLPQATGIARQGGELGGSLEGF